METYATFALVYNELMENVPYELWGDFLDRVIKKYGISNPNRNAVDVLESERNLVLDMGCGTGTLTKIMYDKGYDLIGIDFSTEMLDEARQILDSEVLLLCQDMCEIDLYSTVGTIYASCDTINYLTEDVDVEECFRRVANYLYPGGLFIFDINTVHKYRDVIGEATIAENTDDCSFIWENYYEDDTHINEIDLTLFIKDNESGKYDKSYEEHIQRGYTFEEMRKFLDMAKLELVMAIDENDLSKIIEDTGVCEENDSSQKCTDEIGEAIFGVNEESERIFFVARKPINVM